jgi:hypothetical protein
MSGWHLVFALFLNASGLFGTFPASLAPMAFDSNECCRHAAHCRQLAYRDSLFREAFLHLAKKWESLAAERRALEEGGGSDALSTQLRVTV